MAATTARQHGSADCKSGLPEPAFGFVGRTVLNEVGARDGFGASAASDPARESCNRDGARMDWWQDSIELLDDEREGT
jgi:hypothetical protein